VCLEDLNVDGLIRNRKISKAISDVSWSSFKQKLKYKAEWRNKKIIEINRFLPSSKICNNCGFKHEKLTLNIRKFICDGCGVELDRDLNAAKNIRDWGTDITKLAESKKVIKLRTPKIYKN
jgi:putative transposase